MFTFWSSPSLDCCLNELTEPIEQACWSTRGFTMCATIKFMFGTSFRDIIIRPGGNPKADNELSVEHGVTLIDVRHQFGLDGVPNPSGKEWPKLVHLARLIRDRLLAGDQRIIVQCEAGQSRSVRTVGAFLMLFNNYSRGAAGAELQQGFRQRSPGCAQDMKEDLVNTWLDALQLQIQMRGLATMQGL